MKRFIAVSTAVFAVLSSAVYVNAQTQNSAACSSTQSQENVGGKVKCEKEKPALTDMTLAGKVTKEEKQGKEGKTIVHYILTDAAGSKVMLPGGGKHGKHHEGEQATSVNLEEFINKDVTIVGKGFQKEKDGKKTTRLVEITKIDVVTPTPAAQ